jgi:hypothetical protein
MATTTVDLSSIFSSIQLPSTSSVTITTSTVDSVTLTSSTVLSSSARIVPDPPSECSNTIREIPDLFPACAAIASNRSAAIFNNCCAGAPRVVYFGNCNIYCEARNQSLMTLNKCIISGFDTTGGFNTSDTGLVTCNRIGVSYSSILPANTGNPATRTTSTTGLGGATSSGAAARASGPVGDGRLLVSIGTAVTIGLLVMSGHVSISV